MIYYNLSTFIILGSQVFKCSVRNPILSKRPLLLGVLSLSNSVKRRKCPTEMAPGNTLLHLKIYIFSDLFEELFKRFFATSSWAQKATFGRKKAATRKNVILDFSWRIYRWEKGLNFKLNHSSKLSLTWSLLTSSLTL